MEEKPSYEALEKQVKKLELQALEYKNNNNNTHHLNFVLRAILKVNQAIVKEKEKKVLIRKICDILVENFGYGNAWIVLLDRNKKYITSVQAGLDKKFIQLKEQFKKNKWPDCVSISFNKKKISIIENPSQNCAQCPLAGNYTGKGSYSISLNYDNIIYGVLTVSISHSYLKDRKEQALFQEVGEDIGFALHSFALREKYTKIENEKQALASQLLQAQKMESVGRLAGGVAHDYNNALSVIMGFTEIVMSDMDSENPSLADLNEILTAARKAADITRQLLAFARKQTISPKVLDLNKNIEFMLKMLRRLIGEDIDLAWMPGNDLWPVKMDPSQIDQILANLCVNARDAIAGVGRITIETSTRILDQAYCNDHAGFLPGEFVRMAVSDNGCGMDKDMTDIIFEPFFTTKDVEKGTGLGLSTVYGIVKQNKGFINVYSEPGRGTTFSIYLRRHKGEFEDIPEKIMGKIPFGSGETILVVEDDISILKLVEKTLQSLDYNVLSALTPVEAMNRVREYPGRIHLMITDVIMPEMNGRDLAEHLKSVCPDLICLFMSGYTANAIAHHGVLDEDVHFLQKPFSKKDLAKMIRKALED